MASELCTCCRTACLTGTLLRRARLVPLLSPPVGALLPRNRRGGGWVSCWLSPEVLAIVPDSAQAPLSMTG